MTRRTRRDLRSRRVAAVLLVAVVLTACGGEATPVAQAPTQRMPETSVSAATLPACPELERSEPRPDGLPDLTLACLGEGPAVRLSDLRGTPMVLNVWAAWCTNCDREMPILSSVQERAGDRLRFFGVHYKAPKDYGLRSAADFGVTFPSVHDHDGDQVVSRLDAFAPPQTLFVTADGRVAGRKIGEIRSDQELEDLVATHLGVRL